VRERPKAEALGYLDASANGRDQGIGTDQGTSKGKTKTKAQATAKAKRKAKATADPYGDKQKDQATAKA
jgi:hypothetical protein